MFGHFGQLLVVLAIGLLVFGPKRMIEIGSQAGRAFREFREATKDLNWQSLTNPEPETATGRPDAQSTLSKLSQLSQTFGAGSIASGTTTVEGTVDAASDHAPAPAPVEANPTVEATMEPANSPAHEPAGSE